METTKKLYAVVKNGGYEGHDPPFVIFDNLDLALLFKAGFDCNVYGNIDIYEYTVNVPVKDPKPLELAEA